MFSIHSMTGYCGLKPMSSTEPSIPATDAPSALRHALSEWGLQEQENTLELEGGASTRQFFRVQNEAGTAIAMFTPAPSQEIAKARQTGGPGPFIEVAELLRSRGIRVPQLLSPPTVHNMLLVEDLGDDTLAAFLSRKPEQREKLYQAAVRDLARAQSALEELPPTSSIQKRAFDAELLRWEVDHFRDWALEARGLHLSSLQKEVFDRCAHYLAETIADWPRGYVHRDFQSRNLMVRPSDGGHSLTWIDFQDSMMGPRAYDLVALLTDSYQEFSREFVEQRLHEYCEARGIVGEEEQLRFEFDFLSVQRKLKDAGRFIFIERVNKNPHFLKYVDSTIQRARDALSRVKHCGPLGELEALLNEVLPSSVRK